MAADGPPLPIHDLAGLDRNPPALEKGAVPLRRHEADVLALGLVEDRQTGLPGDRPHLVLGVPGQREEHLAQRLPRDRVEEIGLVLPPVLRDLQPVCAVFRLDRGVMARRDAVEPPGERPGHIILLLPILYAIKNTRFKLVYFLTGITLGVSPQLINQVVQYHGLFNNLYVNGQIGTWQINFAHTIEFLFSPKRGVFTWTPVLLLATWGLFKNRNTLILITLFVVVIVSSSWEAYLSAGFGQRYMFSAIPYFSIGVAYVYNKLSPRMVRMFFAFFSIYNIFLLYGFYVLGWKNLPA